MNNRQQKISHLLGIAFDNDDGHKRITQADKFSLVGGSEQTHDRMTESAIKTIEDLKHKGKSLEDAETDEIGDLLKKNDPGT